MKLWLTVLVALLSCSSIGAQPVWQPSPGHVQLPIWPGTPPNAQPYTGPETVKKDSIDLVAEKPWTFINNVSKPTITVYPAKGRNTGIAVLVCPGGGYQILAIDLEGTEVCDWLNSQGITAVLLKYRVPGEGKLPKSGPFPNSYLALDDAQRAMGLVRLHARQWHINPYKIGVLGFSAGGHLVAAISTHYLKRIYPAIDSADKVSCRPDFAIAIYPGHLSLDYPNLDLNPNVPVTKNTPPTFLLQNEDDNVDGVNQALVYYIGLMKAGVPVEMHLYAQGGHAFGLRRTKLPATHWPDLVQTWLKTIGMIGS